MRRVTSIATIVTMMWFLAAPALAKGPASATLTGPGIDEPIGLFDHHPFQDVDAREAQADLMEMSGIWFGTHLARKIDRPSGLGEPVTIHWGGHYAITQHVYLEAIGGPVIYTPEQAGLDGWGGDPVGWHRVEGDIEGVLVTLGFEPNASIEVGSWTTPFGVLAVAAISLIAIQSFRLRPRRRVIATSAAVVSLLIVPLTANAGGWGIISMDSVPATFEPNTTYSLEYTYLAHGQTPFDVGETEAVFRSDGGAVERFEATNLGSGRYTVDVTLQEGTWTWGINSGGWAVQDMGSIDVAGAPTTTGTSSSIEPMELILPTAAVLTAFFTMGELIRIRREDTQRVAA